MSAPRLTVTVLRGIGAALAEYEAGAYDLTSKQNAELDAAKRWYRAQCGRRGWKRVYPETAKESK